MGSMKLCRYLEIKIKLLKMGFRGLQTLRNWDLGNSSLSRIFQTKTNSNKVAKHSQKLVKPGFRRFPKTRVRMVTNLRFILT